MQIQPKTHIHHPVFSKGPKVKQVQLFYGNPSFHLAQDTVFFSGDNQPKKPSFLESYFAAPLKTSPKNTSNQPFTLKNFLTVFINFRKTIGSFAKTKEQQLELLTNLIWDKFIKGSVLDKPEETKVKLAQFETQLLSRTQAGVIREGTLFFVKLLKQNIDHPDRLRESLRLVVLLLLSGGLEKLQRLEAISSSADFSKLSTAKQGQLMIETLGPGFIKLIQTLNTVPGLFSSDIQGSLRPLYDDVTPIPFEQVKNILETELGIPLEKAFSYVEPKPLKTGSIAQVHRANLPDGQEIALKVVKLASEQTMDEDLAMMEPLVHLAQELYPSLDAKKFFKEFSDLMRDECDMLREAERLNQLQEIYGKEPRLHVPKVIPTHTRKHILAMEFLNGHNLLAFQGPPSNGKIARNYLSLLMDQIFVYGACQADPHPANMPYNPVRNEFNFLDAGLVYFIPEPERKAFAKLLVSLVTQDVHVVANSILKPENYTRRPKKVEKFELYLRSILPSRGELRDDTTLKFVTLAQVAAKEQGLTVYPVNPLLWKTLFTGINVARTLDGSLSAKWIMSEKILRYLYQNDSDFLWTACKATFWNWLQM